MIWQVTAILIITFCLAYLAGLCNYARYLLQDARIIKNRFKKLQNVVDRIVISSAVAVAAVAWFVYLLTCNA